MTKKEIFEHCNIEFPSLINVVAIDGCFTTDKHGKDALKYVCGIENDEDFISVSEEKFNDEILGSLLNAGYGVAVWDYCPGCQYELQLINTWCSEDAEIINNINNKKQNKTMANIFNFKAYTGKGFIRINGGIAEATIKDVRVIINKDMEEGIERFYTVEYSVEGGKPDVQEFSETEMPTFFDNKDAAIKDGARKDMHEIAMPRTYKDVTARVANGVAILEWYEMEDGVPTHKTHEPQWVIYFLTEANVIEDIDMDYDNPSSVKRYKSANECAKDSVIKVVHEDGSVTIEEGMYVKYGMTDEQKKLLAKVKDALDKFRNAGGELAYSLENYELIAYNKNKVDYVWDGDYNDSDKSLIINSIDENHILPNAGLDIHDYNSDCTWYDVEKKNAEKK